MLQHLARQSKQTILAYGLVLSALVYLLDWKTGKDPSVLVFYVLPIFLVAWYAGRRAGVLVAMRCGLIWYSANHTPQDVARPLLTVWNTFMRMSVFVVLAHVVSELAEASRRRDDLMQFIVHDLRTPLANVVASLHLIERSPGLEDNSIKEVAEIGLTSSNRMLLLINSLLDLPRLETGQLPLSLESVDLQDIISQVVTDVAISARHAGVQLDVRVSEDTPLVTADRVITGRVLTNLIANALKFSPAGSTVCLLARPNAKGSVELSVCDQGPGIPAEFAKRVFNKYLQIPGSRKALAGGSGLGLTFCDLAVRAQGGRIWIESSRGSGTTVTFTMPAVPQCCSALPSERTHVCLQ